MLLPFACPYIPEFQTVWEIPFALHGYPISLLRFRMHDPSEEWYDNFAVSWAVLLSKNVERDGKHILDIELSDTLKAHVLKADGNYEKIDKRGKVLLCSQDYFCEEAVKEAEALCLEHNIHTGVFIPAEPLE